MKIKNKHYRKFLDQGIIDPIEEEELLKALKNIKGRNTKEGRALVIVLYYTGCRPAEALQIKAKDITKTKYYVVVSLKGVKKGLPRMVYLPYKKPLVQELYNYASGLLSDMFIFWHFTGSIQKKNNNIETTNKLRYYFTKWFSPVREGGISPYFLRHNRFSKLAMAGVSMEDLKYLKGAKDIKSIGYYTHLSTKAAKKIAKKID